jgi:hypothetical protein
MASRRGVLAAATAAAVVAGGAATYAATRPDHRPEVHTNGDRPGSRVAPGPAVVPATGPLAYRIEYRTDSATAPEAGTLELEVRRPFDARQEETGAAAGKHPVVTVETLGRFVHGALVLAVPPAPPASDLHVAASLGAALDRQLVLRRERRVVAGRPCQVYRTATDPSAGALQAWDRTSDTWNDACIDADGLLLEDVAVEHGAVARRRVATKVERSPTIGDERFATTGDPVPVQKGGGACKQVDDSSRLPDRFWDLPVPPPGFVHVGRYAVRPPQPELVGNVNRDRLLLGGLADAFRSDDGGVLVIDQGATLGGEHPFAADPAAAKVDLGPLGQGELIVSFGTSVVRADLGRGAYVRVAGTLPPDSLVEIARSLVAGPGGTVTPAAG